MPASTEQKVDFLLKKIGYSASKTGGVEGSSGTVDGTKKKPSEEAIPSPLVVPSTSLWSDSVSIPATPPGSDTFPVKVYATASAYRLTVDSSVSESRSFIARSTYGNQTSSIDGNWIDSQFGADYAVRVFKGDPNSGGVELSQAGATGNDTWFFDYSSGILNFNGTDNHSTLGVTDTNIYILGYRYTGGIGAKPPSGIGTFSSLYVTGISTFMGLVDANANVDIAGNLDVDGYTDLDDLSVTGISTLGSIGISTGLITGPAITYIDPATVGDNTGTLVVKGNLQVDGTQTTVNSSTMTVTDKNIVVAQGSANDAASDGAGITVDAGSDTDKTFNWVDSTDAWTSSEHIQVAAGKQLGFADDTNTYIDRPAADNIRFTTGGSVAVTIDENQRLGIGTANPTVPLQINHGSPKIILEDNDNGADISIANVGGAAVYSSASDVVFQTADTSEKVRITTAGKVGIGTVNPQSELHVYKGDASVYTKLESASGASTLELRHTNKYGSLNYYYQGTHKWLFGQVNQDSDISLYQPTGVAAGQNAYRILVKANGNIGIHSTTPTTTLDVNGSVRTNHLNVTGITTSARLNVTGITTVATLNVGVSGQTLVGISTILDEDNMASDSATALATQQSIKKYVDDRSPAGPGGGNLAVSADSGSNETINLNTEVLDIEGTANEIETATGTNKVVIGLPDDVTIANDLTVASNAGIGSLSVTGISTFNGDVTVDADLTANNLTVRDNGTSNPTVMIKSDDQNVNSLIIKNDTYSTNNSIGFKFAQQNNGEFIFSNRGASEYLQTKFKGHNGSAAVDILTFNKDNNVIVESKLKVAGISTFSGNVDVNASADISGNLVVGAAGTTITTTVGAAASVGIGTANPAYMLDVAGAINSSTDVKINGTSVLNSALDEAVAMAIALG